MRLCYFYETYFITGKKIIFQLLVRNKDPFIKPEAALSEHLSLNTKTFALSNVLFATNDHQESFEKKPTRWSSIKKCTIKKQYNIYIYGIYIIKAYYSRQVTTVAVNSCSFF